MIGPRATLLLLLFLLLFGTYMGNSVLAAFYSPVALELGVHQNVIGLIFATYPFFSMISSVYLGSQIKRLGRFPLLAGGVVFFLVSLGGFASLQVFLPNSALQLSKNSTTSTCSINTGADTAVSPGALQKVHSDSHSSEMAFVAVSFTMRAFEGLGAAAIGLAANSYLLLLYPKRIAMMTGLLETVIGLGYAAGPTLGGLLFEAGGWITPFLCLAAIISLTAIPTFIWLLSPRLATLEVEDSGTRDTQLLTAQGERLPLLSEPTSAEDHRVSSAHADEDLEEAEAAEDDDEDEEEIAANNNSDSDDYDDSAAEAWRFENLPDIPLHRLLAVPRVMAIVVTLVAFMILYSFQDPIVPPALLDPCGPYKLTSAVQIGLVFLSCSGTYAILSPVVGVLSDWLPRSQPHLVFIGTLIAGVAMLFMGPASFLTQVLQPSLTLLYVAEFTTGVGGAIALVVAFAVAVNYMKATHKDVNSSNTMSGLLGAAFSLGEIIGPLIASPLDLAVGFGNTAAIIGLIMLVAAAGLVAVFYLAPFVQWMIAFRTTKATSGADVP